MHEGRTIIMITHDEHVAALCKRRITLADGVVIAGDSAMNFIGHCQQALVNLTASKLRSFLAVLGILVGTAAVVALISCGQLATEKALDNLSFRHRFIGGFCLSKNA